MDYVVEPERRIPVLTSADVVVVGGGPAGLAAAIAAARNGATTALIERNNCFGGNATSGMVMALGGYTSWTEPHERVVGGIPQELFSRMVDIGGARDSGGVILEYDPEAFKTVADEMVLDAGIVPFLNSLGVSPWMNGTDIRGVIIESKSGRHAIPAQVVVDATGDADIAARAGVPTEKAENLQPATMCFRLRGVKRQLPTAAAVPDKSIEVDVARLADEAGALPLEALERWRRFRWQIEHPLLGTRTPVTNRIRALMEDALARGELSWFGGPWFAGLDEDETWVNVTRQLVDATDVRSLTRGEIEGRRQVREVIEFWRENVPGFADCQLLMTASRLSIRETRRIVGEHVLCGEDIVTRKAMGDSIAKGCWPIDVHRLRGEVLTAEEEHYRGFKYRPPFQIPYRCLVPLGVDHLLVAGRCISATREGMGAIRVMGTCMALGQAAGTAAALAVATRVGLRNLDTVQLQCMLRDQGALIE